MCVWDVPLLLEAGFEKFVDEVWVVWVPRDLQILRVLARDKLSLAEVEAHAAKPGSRFSLEMHRFSCTHADVSAKVAAAGDVASDVDAMLH